MRGSAPARPPGPGASLDDWLRWQETLHPQPIALGLDRVRPVAERLGVLEPAVPTVTVGGTNGKGSTAALLAEIYRAAGRRVGLYTSPHLLRYHERVWIDGACADDADLVQAFAAVEAARGATRLTYFEFGTLAALWLFQRAGVQLRVLEVGMGGRLDAVNLVDADVAIVTNIGLDHREFLGDTRERIAVEKAGIFRRGRPAICVDPDPPAAIAARAAVAGAPLWQLGSEFAYQRAGDAWNWRGGGVHYKKLPPPALAGEAQLRNAAGAVAAIVRLQDRIAVPEAAIRAGLARLRLRGRFERRGDVVLDVAHNVEAARVLADNLRATGANGWCVAIGMLSDKPVEAFGRALAPGARAFHAAGLPPPRGLSGSAVASRLVAAGVAATAHEDAAEAFRAARAEAGKGELIVVCGSFLTVAAVERLLDG